jgi:hypothetical protein
MPSEGGRGSKVASSHYFQPRSDDDLRFRTSFGLRVNAVPTCTGNTYTGLIFICLDDNSYLLLMGIVYARKEASTEVLSSSLTLFGCIKGMDHNPCSFVSSSHETIRKYCVWTLLVHNSTWHPKRSLIARNIIRRSW